MTEQDVFFNTFDEMWTEKEIQHVYAENLNEQLETLELNCIETALQAHNGNRTKAAQLLNIGRTCLLAKMKKYKLV
jgi:transcriptional regulator with PAS, ATPase and Fis domain